MKFHPATQILAWCLLVAMLQLLKFDALLLASGAVLLCAVFVARHKFAQLLRRTRWIMLSLLLIYAWSTPGVALYAPFGAFSPSREGLLDGLSQLLRLLAALAALAMLLDRLHRMQLISGLYTLFAPLQLLGGVRERFAVRLALTLHYAEAAMLRGKRGWRETLDGLLEPHGESTREMELPLYRFGLGDALLMGAALSLLWWSL
ncbi:MAG: hypothetical protein M0P59_05535 [Gallionella sp.]|nr:hypothetical protein [Gallionella sp.]MCK9353605.1 hypothetical protein [Gallionella sp.]